METAASAAAAAASEDEAAKSHGFLQLSVANLQKGTEAESECALEERDLAPKAAQICHSHSSSINSSGAPSIASTSDNNHSSAVTMGQGDSQEDDRRVSLDHGLEASEDNFRDQS